MKRKKNQLSEAYTLVELSIVLVIFGLLVGGVLAGKSLIRAAELRAMPAEVSRHVTAIHSFQDKYLALPGDMSNATSFWGTETSCPGNFSNPSTDARTCNGDGGGALSWTEIWRAWQHLANAGLVEGQYTGVNGSISTSQYGTVGLNIPASRTSNVAGYGFIWIGSITSGNLFPGNYGNGLRYGYGSGMDSSADTLLGSEAWNIDTKMDDGKPGTGIMRSHTNSHRSLCATTDNLTTAEYHLTTTTKGCNLIFRSGY